MPWAAQPRGGLRSRTRPRVISRRGEAVCPDMRSVSSSIRADTGGRLRSASSLCASRTCSYRAKAGRFSAGVAVCPAHELPRLTSIGGVHAALILVGEVWCWRPGEQGQRCPSVLVADERTERSPTPELVSCVRRGGAGISACPSRMRHVDSVVFPTSRRPAMMPGASTPPGLMPRDRGTPASRLPVSRPGVMPRPGMSHPGTASRARPSTPADEGSSAACSGHEREISPGLTG
jgi:hypothetical protein